MPDAAVLTMDCIASRLFLFLAHPPHKYAADQPVVDEESDEFSVEEVGLGLVSD